MTESYPAERTEDKHKLPIKTVWRDDYHADPYIEELSKKDFAKYKQFLKVAKCLDSFLFNGTLYRIEGQGK